MAGLKRDSAACIQQRAIPVVRTSKEQVRAILDGRFRRWLEWWGFNDSPEQANVAVLAEVGTKASSTVPARLPLPTSGVTRGRP